ncbi:MAG: hypothetical protein Q9168_000336 [Polycauliona sp. 1 TL-2023]
MESGTLVKNTEGGDGLDDGLRRQTSPSSAEPARQQASAELASEARDPLEPAPLKITPSRTPPSATTPAEQTPDEHFYPEAPPSPFIPVRAHHQRPSPSTSLSVSPMTPNWPPVPFPNAAGARANSPDRDGIAARGPPPKRPPRPDYVPPLDSPDQSPQNYWENGFVSPSNGSHKTSGRSPEFSVPFPTQAPLQPRRNLGPPPSARKGGANFYPQNAFVAPIPEEQSDARSSFASSHVKPTTWGDGPPDYYMGSGFSEEDEDEIQSPSSTNDGRDSRAGDHDESTGLVRKVSIGKPGKPALKSVKDPAGTTEEPPRTGQEVRFGPGAGVATFLAPSSNSNSPIASPDEKAPPFENDGIRSQFGNASSPSAIDPRVAKILGGLEKGGALSTAATTPMTSKTGSMSDKGGKRPARLKLDAVKESEPRGSATSLPELIRRATRLASNLDRGKTASRIGVLEMLEKEKSGHPSRGCTTANIGIVDKDKYENATMGTSITRLLNSATSNYSIPLDPTNLLAKFSSQNLTCTSENALVTFNGKPQRRKREAGPLPFLRPRQLRLEDLLQKRHATPSSILDAHTIADRATPAQAAVTSNGLVYAAPADPTSPDPPSSSPSASVIPPKQSSSPSSSSSSSQSNDGPTMDTTSRPLTSNILDFARITILFILQERDLSTAVDVQESMQIIFSPAVISTGGSDSRGGEGNFNASTTDVGAGISVDWQTMTVDLGNGTNFGGKGEG